MKNILRSTHYLFLLIKIHKHITSCAAENSSWREQSGCRRTHWVTPTVAKQPFFKASYVPSTLMKTNDGTWMRLFPGLCSESSDAIGKTTHFIIETKGRDGRRRRHRGNEDSQRWTPFNIINCMSIFICCQAGTALCAYVYVLCVREKR